MKKALASLFFAVSSFVTVSAQATDVYDFSYVGDFNLVVASGQLFANGNDIIGITGFVDGILPITGLLGTANNGAPQLSPSGTFNFDNTIFPGPSLSSAGVLFTVAGGVLGNEWNLWGNGGTSGSLYSGIVVNTFSLATNGTLNISSASVSAVPEPETYAMLLAGMGLIGFMNRRTRRAKPFVQVISVS